MIRCDDDDDVILICSQLVLLCSWSYVLLGCLVVLQSDGCTSCVFVVYVHEC